MLALGGVNPYSRPQFAEPSNSKVKPQLILIALAWLANPAWAAAAETAVTVNIKAAGCFIPTPKGVVLGVGRFRGDLRIPMGKRKPEESAHDTAVRETREETGLEVSVGPLLRTFENGRVYLFLCTPIAPIDDYSGLAPEDGAEIAEVIVLDPSNMLAHDGREITNPWRFAHDRALLTELYSKYGNRH